ncbi:MAG: head GIN domain-containing protein, partial [Sphingomonadaceae bacterium]|nr:head GIN domain-containing protein [Sphingomonadaceae bacterium]
MRKVAMMAVGAAAMLGAVQAQAAERSFTVTGFNAIEVAGPFDVVVNVGKGASVRAVGEAKDLDRLKVEVEGRELGIGSKERRWTDWSRTQPVKIFVTVPSLEKVALAGSGDVQVDRVRAEDFSASIAGSGDLAIASLSATAAKFSIAGSGDLSASGSCRTASVSIAGSGDVNIGGLRCQSLTAKIAGSGGINANATQTAKVSIMGSGDVTVSGGAKCDVSKMGSGSVRCGQTTAE